MESTVSSSGPAGRSIAKFSAEAGISRAAFYLIPEKQRPQIVKIGRRTIVIESPQAWLQRMSGDGGVCLKQSRVTSKCVTG